MRNYRAHILGFMAVTILMIVLAVVGYSDTVALELERR